MGRVDAASPLRPSLKKSRAGPLKARRFRALLLLRGIGDRRQIQDASRKT